MKSLLTTFLTLLSISANAQTTINGIVKDNKGTVIVGANVYLEGTYDGSTTNLNGEFSFNSIETGTQTLIISYLSYESYKL